MKKILMLSAAAMMLAPAAFAEDAPQKSSAPSTPPEHVGGDMLQKIDTDGDGSLSQKEFLSFHEARFKEMDTDGDGKVTKAESEAKRAEWKEKMKKMREQRKQEAAKRKAETSETPKAEKPEVKDVEKPASPAAEKPAETKAE